MDVKTILYPLENPQLRKSQSVIAESRIVWARKGNKISRKFRCSSGPRAGRVVNDPSKCSSPINLKKRMTLRKTKAAKGNRMARKAKRTKRLNPMSKRVQRLNR